MTLRAVLLTDGTSDVPLGGHAAALARRHDVQLDIVTPDFQRLDPPPGLSIEDRLCRLVEFDPDFDLVLIHRDGEAQDPSVREKEIRQALDASKMNVPCIAIIPIRMTEAWLLLDEVAIRKAAGKPSGRIELNLPSARAVETLPDPKAVLREALKCASGLQGRRLRNFDRDFAFHRRHLLENLDRDGVVRSLASWQAFEAAVEQAVAPRA